jgi:hypothetical protein
LVKNDLKALADWVPLGNVLYDIACDALDGWKKRKDAAAQRAELAALAQATADEVRRQVAQFVQEVAAD